MSEYYMTHTGKELDDAINKVKSGYIKPSGSKNITANGTHDVKAYENAIVNVPAGIIPIGNLTDALITRSSTNSEHSADIPTGYYVNSGFRISDWKSGVLSGSGVTGQAYVIPYSSIGFIPRWIAIILNSGVEMSANTVIAIAATSSAGRCNYLGAKAALSSTFNYGTTNDYSATMNSNGVTCPTPTSSVKFMGQSYRWIAVR